MNYKKGVSAISLSIIIVLMIILMATITLSESNILSNTNIKDFASEMIQVKSAVEQYRIRKSGNLDFETSTIELDSVELAQYEGETVSDDKVTLYVVDLSKIDAENVNYGNGLDGEDDRYLWSEETGKIYYQKGYKYSESKTYYTLTDEVMEKVK